MVDVWFLFQIISSPEYVVIDVLVSLESADARLGCAPREERPCTNLLGMAMILLFRLRDPPGRQA